jgi:hypothetical protein
MEIRKEYWSRLPNEIISIIFSYIHDLKTVINLSMTCSNNRRIYLDPKTKIRFHVEMNELPIYPSIVYYTSDEQSLAVININEFIGIPNNCRIVAKPKVNDNLILFRIESLSYTKINYKKMSKNIAKLWTNFETHNRFSYYDINLFHKENEMPNLKIFNCYQNTVICDIPPSVHTLIAHEVDLNVCQLKSLSILSNQDRTVDHVLEINFNTIEYLRFSCNYANLPNVSSMPNLKILKICDLNSRKIRLPLGLQVFHGEIGDCPLPSGLTEYGFIVKENMPSVEDLKNLRNIDITIDSNVVFNIYDPFVKGVMIRINNMPNLFSYINFPDVKEIIINIEHLNIFQTYLFITNFLNRYHDLDHLCIKSKKYSLINIDRPKSSLESYVIKLPYMNLLYCSAIMNICTKNYTQFHYNKHVEFQPFTSCTKLYYYSINQKIIRIDMPNLIIAYINCQNYDHLYITAPNITSLDVTCNQKIDENNFHLNEESYNMNYIDKFRVVRTNFDLHHITCNTFLCIEIPHPIDVEIPHPTDVEIPHPIDVEIPHPIDVEIPHPIDVEIPHPIDVETPHPIDVETPHPTDFDIHPKNNILPKTKNIDVINTDIDDFFLNDDVISMYIRVKSKVKITNFRNIVKIKYDCYVDLTDTVFPSTSEIKFI